MANTAKKSVKAGYTRPQQTEETALHWRDLIDNPDKWESREEVEAIIAKLDVLSNGEDFDKITKEKGVPRRIQFEHPDHRYAMIITEDCRDQLKANGHLHIATLEKSGYECYLFVFTFDLNSDLANYFDYGIDFTTGSVM